MTTESSRCFVKNKEVAYFAINRITICFLMLYTVSFLGGCASTKNNPIVNSNHATLDILDFGSASEDIIYPRHWQWPDDDNHKPVSYDIKVVVYSGMSEKDIAKMYPVVPHLKKDYRYLPYSTAVEFLTKTIHDLSPYAQANSEDSEVYFREVQTLTKTLQTIEEQLKITH